MAKLSGGVVKTCTLLDVVQTFLAVSVRIFNAWMSKVACVEQGIVYFAWVGWGNLKENKQRGHTHTHTNDCDFHGCALNDQVTAAQMQTCSEKKQKKNITNIPSRPPAFNASLVSVTLSAAAYFTDTYVAHNVDSDTSNYLISFLMMCP